MQNKTILFIMLLLVYVTSNAEGVYKWKDAHGNTQYGDKPPKNSHAKSVNMPAITVIENYKEQWKPLNPKPKSKPFTSKSTVSLSANTSKSHFKSSYDSLRFIAPKANQIIRAKDGDVSAMISLKPPLKANHKIVFALNGKTDRTSKSRIVNFKNIPSGNHKVTARVIDSKGNIVMRTDDISFKVQR